MLGSGRLLLAMALMGAGLLAPAARGGDVEGARLWASPESTRVVLDLSEPMPHKIFSLENPHRLVIDLDNSRLSPGAEFADARGLVSSLRSGTRADGVLRVVLDLHQPSEANSFVLEPNDIYGYRLVVDLTSSDPGPTIVRRTPRAATLGGRPVIIAIDAGHGGEDPGATGPRGVREKDVVLGIARALADEVRAQPGMEPILVRDGDYYLRHRVRTERARQAEADLFVSIHADAFRDSRIGGSTVYVLSDKGATDEAAKRLAERENASDMIGGVSLADKDEVLASVLLDLSQNAAISASSQVGDRVIKRLDSIAKIRKHQVQHAPFLVLKSPDIPSILIETAYITNPGEEAALKSSSYQRAMARAIHYGVVDYFRDNPPPGSYIASNPPPYRDSAVRHVIIRGETLSEIAQQYDVSLSALKSSNRLSTDRIRIGQVLTIPVG